MTVRKVSERWALDTLFGELFSLIDVVGTLPEGDAPTIFDEMSAEKRLLIAYGRVGGMISMFTGPDKKYEIDPNLKEET